VRAGWGVGNCDDIDPGPAPPAGADLLAAAAALGRRCSPAEAEEEDVLDAVEELLVVVPGKLSVRTGL
jgi:hypothetical protein